MDHCTIRCSVEHIWSSTEQIWSSTETLQSYAASFCTTTKPLWGSVETFYNSKLTSKECRKENSVHRITSSELHGKIFEPNHFEGLQNTFGALLNKTSLTLYCTLESIGSSLEQIHCTTKKSGHNGAWSDSKKTICISLELLRATNNHFLSSADTF